MASRIEQELDDAKNRLNNAEGELHNAESEEDKKFWREQVKLHSGDISRLLQKLTPQPGNSNDFVAQALGT